MGGGEPFSRTFPFGSFYLPLSRIWVPGEIRIYSFWCSQSVLPPFHILVFTCCLLVLSLLVGRVYIGIRGGGCHWLYFSAFGFLVHSRIWVPDGDQLCLGWCRQCPPLPLLESYFLTCNLWVVCECYVSVFGY